MPLPGSKEETMTSDYIEKMQRKDNLSRAYVQKADDAYRRAGKHSAEEGRYLQEAIKRQFEMAEISDGEERDFHLRRQKELETRLREVVSEVSPETYMKITGKSAGGGSRNTNHASSTAKASGEDAISQETVRSWFKESPEHSFQDVAGMRDLIEQLKACVHDTRLVRIREYMHMRQLHSFLFIGPPGCGKTYIVEAFAHELMEKDYQYMSVDASDILSRYVGDAEKIIARLFEEAEKNAPCIVFLDEIDGVCKNRSIRDLPVWASNMTTAFLTAYNRIQSSDKPVILLGATNYPTQVDSAMMDRVQVIRIPFPDEEARAHAFRLKFEKFIRMEDGFGYEEIAGKTDRWNYRDIDRLTELMKKRILEEVLEQYPDEDAAVEAMESGAYRLTRALFEDVYGQYQPSPKEAVIRELSAFEESLKAGQERKG